MRFELTNDKRIEAYARALYSMGDTRGRQVLSAALNKTGDKSRTRIKRALAQATGIKYGQIPMRTIRSRPGTLQYEIQQPGDETNLNLFGARQGARGVSARPWGIRRTFPGTFTVSGWGQKVYSRDTASRFPVSPLWGPNLAREILKDKPIEAFETSTDELQVQVERQMRRALMGGFGF